MTIDRDSAVPPYKQLAEILRQRITSGEIPPGRRIPSQSELEQEFAPIGRNTIKRAVEILKNEGLLESSPGLGLYVKREDS